MVSLVLMGGLIALLSYFNSGMYEEYNLTGDGSISGEHPIQNLSNINLINGFEEFTTGIHKISSPGNLEDVLGGLAASGIGFLKTTTGIITFPGEIIASYSLFFSVPSEVFIIIGIIIIIYISFIIIDRYTQSKN